MKLELTEDEKKMLQDDGSKFDPDQSTQRDDKKKEVEEDKEAAKEPVKKADEEPAKEKPADDEDDGKDEFSEFVERNKGKSAEDLLRLAFNQNKARLRQKHVADGARSEAEENRAHLQTIINRLEQARQAKDREVAQRAANFEEELKNDPDAATKRAYYEMLERERQETHAQQYTQFVEQQRQVFESSLYKETGKKLNDVASDLVKYAVEDLGYTPDEISRASDARDLLTLDRARRFTAAVKAGHINADGSPRNSAAAPAQQAPATKGSESLARAAKAASAPRTLSDARGGKTDGRKSLREQALEVSNMPLKDFGALADSGELLKMLKELDEGAA